MEPETEAAAAENSTPNSPVSNLSPAETEETEKESLTKDSNVEDSSPGTSHGIFDAAQCSKST